MIPSSSRNFLKEQESHSFSKTEPKTEGLSLFFVMLLAIVVRIVCYVTVPSLRVLGAEEMEYLRLAQNLFDGNGYVGLYGTTQIVHSPLYPIVVALINYPLRNIEFAGLVVSLVFGVLLSLVLYFLALNLYGSRAALFAATLASIYPYLLYLSVQTFSEALFITLLMTSMLFGVLALKMENLSVSLCAGLTMGLTYLARPTGIVIGPLILIFMIVAGIWRRIPMKTVGLHLLVTGVTFTLVTSLYMAFLFRNTGHLMFDGKSLGLRVMSLAIYEGANLAEAGNGIDENLRQTGFQLDHTNFTLELLQNNSQNSDFAVYLQETIAHLIPNSLKVLKYLLKVSLPFVFFLCILGFLEILRRVQLWPENFFVFCTFCILLLIQFLLPWFHPRYAAPLVPFLILWSAAGFEWLVVATSRKPKNGPINSLFKSFSSNITVALVTFVIAFSLIPYSRSLIQKDNDYINCSENQKEIGQWLRQSSSSDLRIADKDWAIPYYADGTILVLPYSDEDTALRYLAKHNPTHIVVSAKSCSARPYLCSWLTQGIPDNRAKLVYEIDSPSTCSQKLYEWQLNE